MMKDPQGHTCNDTVALKRWTRLGNKLAEITGTTLLGFNPNILLLHADKVTTATIPSWVAMEIVGAVIELENKVSRLGGTHVTLTRW